MSIEAMKHYEAALLEAFPKGATGNVFEHWNKARIAAEAEKQEPVGEVLNERGEVDYISYVPKPGTPLYTHPQPKREWVGLTEDEKQFFKAMGFSGIDIVEAKLKEKNT